MNSNHYYTGHQAIVHSEFVFRSSAAAFATCHVSTIAETHGGLVAAWFGGTREAHPDVAIWLSRQVDGIWTRPEEVANGVEGDRRYPAWNPVLFYHNRQMLLFFKIGPNPRKWRGLYMTSSDSGISWSIPTDLPQGLFGPVKNKPLSLADGSLLCPSGSELGGWTVHMELSKDMGKTWTRTESLNDPKRVSAIQPAILVHPDGALQMLCRTRNNRIYSAWSGNKGSSWTQLERTQLPNPNSGIDAVTLRDGRHLLVYNHIEGSANLSNRNMLNIAVSENGTRWEPAVLLEYDTTNSKQEAISLENVGSVQTEHEYSYPAVIQSSDGMVHVTYTWKRQTVKHVTIDPEKIDTKSYCSGEWPSSGE